MEHAAPRARRKARPREQARPVRDVLVACASAGVLALLGAYAVAAPTSELTASVGPTIPRPGSQAVVEGRVLEADGSGLAGARIEVERDGRTAATAVSSGDGAFRLELDGGCSVYVISIRSRADGGSVEAAARRRLCPGDSLPVQARVVTHGHFLWVPGPR
jgi:hypothetical protein